MCVLWMSIPTVERRGRNKQMMGKLTLSTQLLSFSKENIRNFKQSDMFTHLSVVQIFRLRLGPDVSSNPLKPERNGMTQSPTKYVTQIRKQGEKEKEECVSVFVCALHFKLPNVDAV